MDSKYMLELIKSNTITKEDTIKFSCKGCGMCCRKRVEPVIINGVDIFYIARELDISPLVVTQKYGEHYIGDNSKLPVVVLKEREDGSCSLLRKGRCTVHSNKPAVCAIYPLGRYIENGTGEYTYFMQPNQCAGMENAETVTLGQWLKQFNIEAKDKECLSWVEMITSLTKYMRSVKLDNRTRIEYTIQMFKFMYIEYDTTKELLPQIEENKTRLREIIRGLEI